MNPCWLIKKITQPAVWKDTSSRMPSALSNVTLIRRISEPRVEPNTNILTNSQTHFTATTTVIRTHGGSDAPPPIGIEPSCNSKTSFPSLKHKLNPE